MYYFAYGSNLNRQQMRERCPDSQTRFIATLHHYKLVFVGWSRQRRGGAASIRAFRDEKVMGGIYEVSEECLKRLDRYEGPDYQRSNVKVNDEDNELIEAVTHINVRQAEETRPSPEYLSVIQQGYKDWGLF